MLSANLTLSIDAKSEGISFVSGMTAMSKEYMMRAPFRPWRRCDKCSARCMHCQRCTHFYSKMNATELDLSCFDFRYNFWDKEVMREVAEANDAVVAVAATGKRVLERYRAQHTEDEMRDDTSIIAHLIRR